MKTRHLQRNDPKPAGRAGGGCHPFGLRVIHWLVAGLIIAALAMSALVMSAIPDGSPQKIEALRRHISVGLLVLVLTVARLFVRRQASRLSTLSSGMRWADRLAVLVHRGFDLMILAMIGSGLAMALLGGLLPAVLGEAPGAAADLSSLPFLWLHRGIAILLATFLLLHVAGALYHQWILRDGLLARMGLGAKWPATGKA